MDSLQVFIALFHSTASAYHTQSGTIPALELLNRLLSMSFSLPRVSLKFIGKKRHPLPQCIYAPRIAQTPPPFPAPLAFDIKSIPPPLIENPKVEADSSLWVLSSSSPF